MEVPPVEDSMEMASPYQGQADDFDIDIDLMEDQVSNMDSDMMGADDFPNTSQPSIFPNNANDDADMADEPTEGSMVDADNYAQEDNDIDVQYEETTYEAEMLEGDQAEVIEALEVPVPSVHVEDPPSIIEDTHRPNPPAPKPTEQEAPDTLSVVQPSENTNQSPEDKEPETLGLDQPDHGRLEQPQVPEKAEATIEQEKIELEDTNETTEDHLPITEERKRPESSVGGVEASQTEPSSHETATEHTADADAHAEHETEAEAANVDESLHPVKVIYQDNEISLFPPLEGDSAETFFLHDEDVAYDKISKLFSSLREVLMDNVAEDEVLIIDIESLGIQITEVSDNLLYIFICDRPGTNCRL